MHPTEYLHRDVELGLAGMGPAVALGVTADTECAPSLVPNGTLTGRGGFSGV